jgi:SagB-type dehydrogenase family enzyme
MSRKGIGREFMEKTRYKYLSVSAQRQGLAQPPLQAPYQGEAKPIDLPASSSIKVPEVDLRLALEARESVRRYANQPLELAELSYLLWCTQGVKGVQGDYATFRNVPSAGARHAFETYLLVNHVESLPPGLYRFLALEHKLVAVDLEPGIAEAITKACWDQAMVQRCAVTFIWVAVAERMTWRYGQRGYRYIHLDAGHVCQNLYLAAEAIEGGVCAIAAFSDEDMNHLLGLDGEEQFVIYLATMGKRP